jgi:hypothetical protein
LIDPGPPDKHNRSNANRSNNRTSGAHEAAPMTTTEFMLLLGFAGLTAGLLMILIGMLRPAAAKPDKATHAPAPAPAAAAVDHAAENGAPAAPSQTVPATPVKAAVIKVEVPRPVAQSPVAAVIPRPATPPPQPPSRHEAVPAAVAVASHAVATESAAAAIAVADRPAPVQQDHVEEREPVALKLEIEPDTAPASEPRAETESPPVQEALAAPAAKQEEQAGVGLAAVGVAALLVTLLGLKLGSRHRE